MAKKLVFGALMLVGVYACIELFAWTALGLLPGKESSLGAVKQRRAQLLRGDDAAVTDSPAGSGRWHGVMLHPYTGYVMNPAKPKVHDFGFQGVEGFFFDDPSTVVVGVTGGSVSQSIWKRARKKLESLLSEIPEFQGRPIEVISMGAWGYKQPQQLATLSYFLAVGGRLDILINVDGVNEIGNGNNIRAYHRGSMHPVYPAPHIWNALSKGLGSPTVLAAAGRVELLRKHQREWAELADHFRFSSTAELLWQLRNHRLEIEILEGQQSLGLAREEDDEFSSPHLAETDGDVSSETVYQYIADMWVRCSLQMEYLARGNHISYYHFLQPNQYVPGSKKLSEAELESAYDEKGLFHDYVAEGYPLLQARAQELRRGGVRFHDLTGIFRQDEGDIYIDNCCHTNVRGDQLIAAEIVRIIREDLEEVPCFSPGEASAPAVSTRRCSGQRADPP
jgi:hypothetical protein